MKKSVILLAAVAVLCCGCGTMTEQTAAFNSGTEMTAPSLEDVSMADPAGEEMTAPPLDAVQEEMTAPPLEVSEDELDAPPLDAVQAEPAAPVLEDAAPAENRDADFAWFGRGVYEARIDGKSTGEYYVFNDKSSGTFLTAGFSYSFTCEQTRLDVAFHMDGSDAATIYAMSGPDANGVLTGDMGEVRYTFTLLPVAPEEFSLEGWEQTHQEE
ncbi:MAG: hypothetical protein IKN55_02500 [Oscillospiraceae bacterium]|nr:hypothetical protein [Oscillospiraceae bacterium]